MKECLTCGADNIDEALLCETCGSVMIEDRDPPLFSTNSRNQGLTPTGAPDGGSRTRFSRPNPVSNSTQPLRRPVVSDEPPPGKGETPFDPPGELKLFDDDDEGFPFRPAATSPTDSTTDAKRRSKTLFGIPTPARSVKGLKDAPITRPAWTSLEEGDKAPPKARRAPPVEPERAVEKPKDGPPEGPSTRFGMAFSRNQIEARKRERKPEGDRRPPGRQQTALGQAAFDQGEEDETAHGGLFQDRNTLTGLPAIRMDAKDDEDFGLDASSWDEALEAAPNFGTPNRTTTALPNFFAAQNAEVADRDAEAEDEKNQGLFKMPGRTSLKDKTSLKDRTVSSGRTLMGIPTLDKLKAEAEREAQEARSAASKGREEEPNPDAPGQYILRKKDLSKRSEKIRLNASIKGSSDADTKPPVEVRDKPGRGRTMQMSVPVVGEGHPGNAGLKVKARSNNMTQPMSVPVFGSGAKIKHADPPGDAFPGHIDARAGEEDEQDTVEAPKIAIHSNAELSDGAEGASFKVRSNRPASTQRLTIPSGGFDRDSLDDSGDGQEPDAVDSDTPLATASPATPEPEDFAHKETAAVDVPAAIIEQAQAPKLDPLADTGEQKAPAALITDNPPSAPPESIAPLSAPNSPDRAAPPVMRTSQPVERNTEVPSASADEKRDSMLRAISVISGGLMFLVPVMYISAGLVENLGGLASAAVFFPALGGAVALVSGLVSISTPARAAVLGVIGSVTVSILALADLPPLSGFGDTLVRALALSALILPIGLFWRSSYKTSWLARVVVGAGMGLLIVNYVLPGAGGQMRLMDLVGLFGPGGASGAVLGIAALLPLTLLLPSLLAFTGPKQTGLGVLWSVLYAACLLLIPVAAGIHALSTGAIVFSGVLPYAGLGMALFTAALCVSAGWGELLGWLTRPNED